MVYRHALNEVSNSFVWFFTLIPICYHAGLLFGLVHVWLVLDTVHLQSEDEKRQMEMKNTGLHVK